MSFSGRVVMVTGAASGIGRAIAELFSERGARVCIADVNADGAAAVADQLEGQGHSVVAVTTDVAEEASVTAAIQEIEGRWSELHFVINCAGIDLPTRLEELTEDVYDRILAIDQKGVYLVSRKARPLIARSGGGAIVNISSVMAWYTAPGYAAYTTAKAGVLGLTRALAVELGPENIRVNAVCPGFIDTPIWQRNLDAMDPERAEEFAERIRKLHPVGRRGRPMDVAQATAFLCSEEAAFITGTYLIVDGGVSTQLVSA